MTAGERSRCEVWRRVRSEAHWIGESWSVKIRATAPAISSAVGAGPLLWVRASEDRSGAMEMWIGGEAGFDILRGKALLVEVEDVRVNGERRMAWVGRVKEISERAAVVTRK
jgi:hypothetical protein